MPHPVVVNGLVTIVGVVASVVVYLTGWGGWPSALIAPAIALALPYLGLSIGFESRKVAIVACAVVYVILVLIVSHILVATASGPALRA